MNNHYQKNQNRIKYLETVFSETTRFPKINRDFSGVFNGRYGKLFIVSRGIGNDGCEEISQLAVATIKSFFDKMPEKFNCVAAIKQAFTLATKEVLTYTSKNSTLESCCASVALLLINVSGVFIAHAGDCRVMLIREGKISNLTEDHFAIKDISGFINSKQSVNMPIISNTIGLSRVEPEILEDVQFFKDDLVLLMTKGVYQRITRREMTKAFANNKLSEGIEDLWNFAKDKKSNDDFSIIGLKITKFPPIPIDPILYKKEMRRLLQNVALLFVSLIMLFFTIFPVVF